MKKNKIVSKKPTKQERLNAIHRAEKIKKEIITISIIILTLVGFYLLISNTSFSQNFTSIKVNKSQVPKGPIHWHPQLTILIDGVPQKISANVGITPAKHEQTHTHDTDGIIHLENSNPKANPDSLSLGYFFKIWKKTFNSTCILDKCTDVDGGNLKFSVNGIENKEFERYIFTGEEKVLIEYSSN